MNIINDVIWKYQQDTTISDWMQQFAITLEGLHSTSGPVLLVHVMDSNYFFNFATLLL